VAGYSGETVFARMCWFAPFYCALTPHSRVFLPLSRQLYNLLRLLTNSGTFKRSPALPALNERRGKSGMSVSGITWNWYGFIFANSRSSTVRVFFYTDKSDEGKAHTGVSKWVLLSDQFQSSVQQNAGQSYDIINPSKMWQVSVRLLREVVSVNA
jgi:hypothetical protein